MNKKSLVLFLILAISLTVIGCKNNDKEITKEKEAVKTEETAKTEVKSKTETKTETATPKAETKTEEKTSAKPVEQKAESSTPQKTASLSNIRSEIESNLNINDAMNIETSSLNDLYGIDSSLVKQSASFVTMSGTFPNEIIMVEAVNSSAADKVSDLLNNKLNEVLNQSKTYDAENYELAKKCKVSKNGNFVSLFISPNYTEIKSIYDKSIK